MSILIHTPANRFHVFALLLLTLTAILAYSNSFNSSMTLDDHANIINNRHIKIKTISIPNLVDAAIDSPMPFRALPYITFAINHAIHGLQVTGYHAVNLASHVTNGFLLYLLALTTLNLPVMASSCKKPKEVALAGALLWLVHPVQTNAVTYIVQRMTSLAALFVFCTLLCYIQGRISESQNSRRLYLGATIFSAFFALISKETSAILPLLILSYELFFLRSINWKKKGLQIGMILGLALTAFFLLALLYLGTNPFETILSGYARRNFTLAERLLTEPRVIIHYLTLILLPLPARLNLNYDFTVSHSLLSPPQTILSILALIGMITAIPILYKRHRLLSFALCWFLINLAIESTVIPLELIFEHRLYLPSAFLCVATFFYLEKITYFRPAIFYITLFFLVTSFATFTWIRNKDWQTEISIWTDVIQKSPNLARGYVNLGRAESELGNLQVAVKHLEKAIILEPSLGVAYYNLGLTYDRMGRQPEALNVLTLAVDKKEIDLAQVHDSLGIVYRKMGNCEKAVFEAHTALNLNSDLLEPYVTIGICYENSGQTNKALAIFQEASAKGLDSEDLHNNWAISLATLGLLDQAVSHLIHAVELKPEHFESNYNLGVMYSRLGMEDLAEQQISRAIMLKNTAR